VPRPLLHPHRGRAGGGRRRPEVSACRVQVELEAASPLARQERARDSGSVTPAGLLQVSFSAMARSTRPGPNGSTWARGAIWASFPGFFCCS
jgi:hypothetical protein